MRLAIGFMSPGERTRYFILIVARALTGLLDVFGIALIGYIASVAAAELGSTAAGTSLIVLGVTLPRVDGSGLFVLVVGVLGVFVAKAIVAIVLVRGQAYFVARVEARNAEKVAAYVLRGSLDSAKRFSKAEFQWALTGSTTYAFTGLLNNVASMFAESFLLLVVTATFFIVNPLVAIFALGYFGLVVVVIQVFIGRSLKRAGEESVAGTVLTANGVSDTLDTFREISVLGKQQLYVARIARSRARLAQSDATMTFLAGMPRYVVETALILGVVILVAQQFLSDQGGSGLVTVGVFLAGGVRMMASLLPLQSALSNIKQNVEKASIALGLLSEVRQSELAAKTPGPAHSTPSIESALAVTLSNVSYRYPGYAGDTIHAVSLAVTPGSYAAIIGPSGSGKTTLVDLILGLVEPRAGSVKIGSMPPTAIRELAPGLVAYVPQRPGLVSGTIAENIALGVEAADIDQVRLDEVVDAAYLREFIDSLPDGLATSVGKQVDALSGGQIQRIGVARALYSRPRLIVLDEATSGLDASSEAYIAASLHSLHGAVTVIVIAHRLSTVQHADVVHVVEGGRVTAVGDFKTVQATVPMVAEYVKLMSFDENRAGAHGESSE